jgi:hypothetical protein
MIKPVFLIFTFVASLFLQEAFCAQLRLDFSQDNRTYVWNTELDCDRKISRGLSWGFSSSINSMLTKSSISSREQNRWQENGRIDLDVNYALASRLKLGALFSQNINSLEKRKVTGSEYDITSEYDISGLKIVQIMGVKNIDRRWDEGRKKDTGFNHVIGLAFSPQILSQSITQVSFNQTNSRLSNIPLVERDFDLSFAKNFSEEDSLEFSYHEGWSKKKFYQGDLIQAAINTQRSRLRLVELRSTTRIPSDLSVGFDFNFVSTGYEYGGEVESGLSTLRNNRSASQNFRLEIKRAFFQRISMGGFYKYTQSKEDYADDERDQKMESGELGGNLLFGISGADSLYLSTSVGVTSFYTSEVSARLNDRDILTLFAWGEYVHVFSSMFSLRMEGGFRNFHRVYMSNRLSANNNHNQTYVLSPTLIWRPHPRLDLKQNYNIQANYIYYDYEKSGESTKNRLFRRASSSTSMNYRIFTRVSLAFGYTYGYEDYGQLIWRDQWVRKPSWERRTQTFNLSMEYKPAVNLVFSPEYTYQIRKTWDHYAEPVTFEKMRTLSDKFHRNLISLSCRYLIDDRNYISLTGARRVQESTEGYEEISDYATVSVSRIF